MRYYLDTCVWRDYVEEREGRGGRPLGTNAVFLITKLISQKAHIYYSPVVLDEIKYIRSRPHILELMNTLARMGLLSCIPYNKMTSDTALLLSKDRKVPFGDAHHAVLARIVGATVVSTDPHFKKLRDIASYLIPEHV